MTTESEPWIEGGIYSMPSDDGTHAIVKILKLDPEGVHIRVYSNRYAEIPEALDESALYMARVDDPTESLAGRCESSRRVAADVS